MNSKKIITLLFASAICLTGSALYAGGPGHEPRRDRDGVDTAARIVDLVLRVIRPETTVVVQTPAPVPVVTRTVYAVPRPQPTVERTVYVFPGTVYTETVYEVSYPVRPVYVEQSTPPRHHRPGFSPRDYQPPRPVRR